MNLKVENGSKVEIQTENKPLIPNIWIKLTNILFLTFELN